MELLLEELNKRGVKLRLDGDDLRIAAPQGAVDAPLRDALRQNKAQLMSLLRGRRDEEAPLPQIVPDLAALHEPFPLTPIQHAYWMGRGSAMEMGNVATHLYVELDCDNLDVTRLSDALNRLIERHPMLRAVVGTDGQQRILAEVPRYAIALSDQSLAAPPAAEQAAEATREILSHQVLKPDQWPLFDIRATRLPAQRLRLHVSLDLLILDAWSIFLFFREWSQLYEEPATQLAPQRISFRDYVLAEQQLHDSDAYRKAERYWLDRVDTLPPAPELPMRSDPAARQAPRFSRRQSMLDKARWTRLKASAQAQDLTPSGLLMALYAEVLARWASSPHFTLNVTISNRLPMHADVPQLIGDFTSLLLQEVDGRRDANKPDRSFLAFAQGLQKQFATDLDNRLYSGMHVMREWAKRRGIQRKAVMPVVFSSGLVRATDANDPGSLDQLGSKVFSVSQTSQVWLDHHVMEQQGDLVFIWDAADAVFEDGVLDAMFGAYCDSIRRLADDPQLWLEPHVLALPAEMQARRLAVEDSGHALPTRCLHAGLVEQARLQPDAPALAAGGRCMSYAQLLSESAAVADVLMQRGIRPGEPVAVLMRKGWEQIVAVYGVLLAGGAYMPIDADLPVKRQSDLLRIGEVRQLLVQPDSLRDGVELGDALAHKVRPGVQGVFGPAHEASLKAPLDQLAYTIYTSGTTGVPKGVMIDHRGAMNTIEHMNRLFGVQATDKALGVSSLSFDLSVYDIFGLHAAGGTLVLPDAHKGHDAQHWRELVLQHGITLWNSAPQLMRMLMDSYVAGDASGLPLRTVLLSGDFIPLDLPDRLRHRSPGAQVISLGGATEASIWSIYYPIDQVSPAWASIPYGKPLPNQSVRVYDKSWQLCPDQVKGKIYIGGTGLAMGYWRDAEKTAARFVTHPGSGERLYDTGDLGRYAADGNVVIMGRDDSQIKIRGHRIELGEIEAVLRRHPGVRAALVVAVGEPLERRQLAAYIEPHAASGEGTEAIDTATLQAFVGERLPDYMVPRHVVLMERLPTSSNGKIDTSALPPVDDAAQAGGTGPVPPRTETEKTVLDIWSRVMGLPLGVTDNFFELGGDSVMATQMVRELSAVFPVVLEMHELFENLTVEGVAALYDQKLAALADGAAPAPADAQAGDAGHVGHVGNAGAERSMAERSMADPAEVEADLRTVVAKLDALDFDAPLPADIAAPRAVLVTGATGWIGGHAVGALLAQTETRVICLVRGSDAATARLRLLSHLHELDIATTAALAERIEVVCGDLAQPMLGLDSTQWTRLLAELDAVYHFGASLNVTAGYASHSATNVHSLEWLVRLAAEHHRKPLVAMSPMTICRRHIGGQLVVHAGEQGHADPQGLLTTYAQSKWAAEQVLLAAAQRGLPVRIYRSSHALPAARNGIAKANDTYNTVLKVACQVGAVPDWTDSRLPGLPVDLLCRLLVDDATSPGQPSGIAHLENLDPLHFKDLLGVLLATRGEANPSTPELLPQAEWKARCAAVTEGLSEREEALVKLLFGKRSVGTGVDNIFSNHGFETRHFQQRGWAPKLAGLTPASYWHTVCRRNGW